MSGAPRGQGSRSAPSRAGPRPSSTIAAPASASWLAALKLECPASVRNSRRVLRWWAAPSGAGSLASRASSSAAEENRSPAVLGAAKSNGRSPSRTKERAPRPAVNRAPASASAPPPSQIARSPAVRLAAAVAWMRRATNPAPAATGEGSTSESPGWSIGVRNRSGSSTKISPSRSGASGSASAAAAQAPASPRRHRVQLPQGSRPGMKKRRSAPPAGSATAQPTASRWLPSAPSRW